MFYSNKKTTRHKPYAKDFKKRYPNVYRLINEKKPKDNESELSNSMMSLESEIFHKILEKLYKKRGCNVLTIHDAIVLLDTKGSQKYQPEDIERVMQGVFHEYSLYPTINTEYLKKDQWKIDLEAMERNQPKIEWTLNEIRNQAKDQNHEHQEATKDLLRRIEEGEVELIVVDNVVRLHRFRKV